jgi:hypothetical protein
VPQEPGLSPVEKIKKRRFKVLKNGAMLKFQRKYEILHFG